MSRSKKGQVSHDKKVRQEVNKLKRKGFDVKADLPGFEHPKTLGGFRPDIIATKNKQRKIVEVETPESKESARDKSQQQAFKKIAKQSNNTTFRREITKK